MHSDGRDQTFAIRPILLKKSLYDFCPQKSVVYVEMRAVTGD